MIIKYEAALGYNVELHYKTAHPLRKSYKGKHWPKTTQCLIFLNGLLKGSGEVVKHENEKSDNFAYALRLATKKAIPCLKFKDSRIAIWKLLDKEIKIMEANPKFVEKWKNS